ncbi:MAG TPA: ATP-binding protein [Sphingomicrobium sp.]
MRLRPSLAIRLTIALIGATFLATASILGGIYYFSVKRPMDEVRAQVHSEARALSALYQARGEGALREALVKRRRSPSPYKPFDALLDRRGDLLTGNLPSWPNVRRGDWAVIEADLYRDGDEDDHEALTRDLTLPDGKRLLVGRDIEILSDRKELMVEAGRWGALPVLLFGLIGGILISWITGRRLEAVGRTARAVMQGDLSIRVPIKGTGDEFDELGMSLNAMLDRNQELVASLSRVSDSIAHELRTPLARLRSSLEGIGAGEVVEVKRVEAAQLEAERLQQTFDALLRIARLDTGRHRISRDQVQLDALVSDAVDFYEPEAAARQLAFSLSVTPCKVLGDRNLLFQAVANLLDNGIKFAPEHGQLRVELFASYGLARIAVTDNGAGVEEAHHPRLSEPFFRAPGSEAIAGTGLGLTLVSAIAIAHEGSLTFNRTSGSFSAILTVPLADHSR